MIKRNVLFLYLNRGNHFDGASKMLSKLLPNLINSHNVVAILNENSAIYKHFILDKTSLQIYRFSAKSRIEMLRKYFLFFRKLELIILENNIEIIWTPNLLHFLLIFPIVKRNIKIIANHWLIKKGFFYKLLYLFEYFFSDLMIYEYKNQPKEVINSNFFSSNDKNVLIYTGCSFSDNPISKPDISNKIFTIGMVGQINSRKGILEGIKSIKYLSDINRLKDFRFLIVGDIPNEYHKSYLKNIFDEIYASAIKDKFIFTGWVNDVENELKKMDLFLFLSYSEGLSGSLREAASMGIPIVATKVGGNNEVVMNGFNGLLVEPGNIKNISDSILKIMNNYDFFKNNSILESKKIRNRFSLDTYISQYSKILKQI